MLTGWFARLLLVGVLAGCAGIESPNSEPTLAPATETPTFTFETDLFNEPVDIIDIEDVFRLSGEQQADFLAFFQDPAQQGMPAHRRVYEYLETVTMNFGYQGRTYAAEESLERSAGNCLSLAILTTSLAELAGVETGYQLVDSAPVFASMDNIVFRGQHVRTKLLEPLPDITNGEPPLRRGGLLVDYFPSDGDRFIGNISVPQYHAMYYNNLASEAIAREDYNTAYWLLRKVLELTPQDAGAFNSMAVVFRRAGDERKAEEIYRYGIAHLPAKVSLLRNYRILLVSQGRLKEADAIAEALADLNDVSPFDWLHAGRDAYDKSEYREAVAYYKKAVEVAPYLHEGYAGLAKAYYKLGYRSRAIREFEKAQKFSQQKSVQDLYQAKLMALTGKAL